MKACIVIPARLASTRLSRKVLADINGEPMIVRVWRQAEKSNIETVMVACDHKEIYDAIYLRGGTVMMTSPKHLSGSDRVNEIMEKFDPEERFDVVINLQGDMPLFNPKLMNKVLQPLKNPDVDIATLVHPITDDAELIDPSVVKAVLSMGPNDKIGKALYFTRSNAPYGEGISYHHQGIYAYRREALKQFVSLKPGWLEKREKLEQLRALEHGMRIDAIVVNEKTLSVDTQDDLDLAREICK